MFFPIFSRENEKYCSAKETLVSLLIEQLLDIEDWKNCSKTFINFLSLRMLCQVFFSNKSASRETFLIIQILDPGEALVDAEDDELTAFKADAAVHRPLRTAPQQCNSLFYILPPVTMMACNF